MTVSLNLYNEKIAGVQHREEINTRIQEIDAFVRNYSLYEISDDDIKTTENDEVDPRWAALKNIFNN